MIDFISKDRYDFSDLVRLVHLLRQPGGCPWDGAQTHLSIRRNFLEEAYEACEGFDADDPVKMREELGDVLLQVLFHTDIEQDAGRFTLDDVCDTVCKKLDIKDMRLLNSAAGRLVARPIEAMYVAELMEGWIVELVEYLANGGAEFFTEKAREDGEGVGLWEAPRGALLHCEKIKNNKIVHYQAVVPTAWNISPRDNNDLKGTIEEALIGTPVKNLKAPINALRIVHGYDPCVACAIHVVEPKTGQEFEIHTTPWGGR